MPMTLALILLTAMLMSNGCGASRPASAQPFLGGSGTMAEQFEITYRVRDGRPPADLDLHLSPDGQAEVYVGTSTSIPLASVNRVGTFSGQAPVAELDALYAYLREHDLLARGASYGQLSPSTPNRFLEIRAGGWEAQLKLTEMTTDPEIDGFEELLQSLALAMTSQPTRAVEASLELRDADGQIVPTIELRSIGSEPMTALLADPAQPVFTLYAQVELRGTKTLPTGVKIPAVLGNVAFSPDDVQAMAASGELPSGVAEIPPDAVYRFELPPITALQDASSVTATGSVDFWLPEGKARRGITVLTPDVPLP
jgi:hypothetical protein